MFRSEHSEVSEEEHQIVNKNNSKYSCDICKAEYTNQFQFFQHLKVHYEGTKTKRSSNVCQSVENIEGQMISTFFATTEFEKPPEAIPSKDKRKKERRKRKTCRTVKPEDRSKTKKVDLVDAPNAPDVVHVCTDCSKTFKNQGTYLAHIKTCSNKKRNNLFEIENKTKRAGEIKCANTEEEKEIPEDTTVAFENVTSNEESADDGDAFDPNEVFESDNALNDPSVLRNRIDGNDHRKKPTVNIKTRRGDIAAVCKSSKKCDTVKTKKYKCIQCQKDFNQLTALRYHLRVHSGERPYPCETCEQKFYTSSALKVHSRIHSGMKPYKCDHCGRQFRQWGDLKYHSISIHSDIRQFQCEFCGKDFARKYSLTVHRRIHTGERDYKCEFCDKGFRAASYLSNHRRIHTGEKPYACTICGKPFRVNSDLKRHMVTHVGLNNQCRTTKSAGVKQTVTGEVTASEEQQALKNESKLIQGRGTLQVYEISAIPGDLSGETHYYLPTAVSSATFPSAELKEVLRSCPRGATLQTINVRDISDMNMEVLYILPD